MWVELRVGSRPYSEVFSESAGFASPTKKPTSKFQIDPERVDREEPLRAMSTAKSYYCYY